MEVAPDNLNMLVFNVHLHMYFQIGQARGLVATYTADTRLHIYMHELMAAQVGPCNERFSTHPTDVCPFLSMRQSVPFQITRIRERLVAKVAHIFRRPFYLLGVSRGLRIPSEVGFVTRNICVCVLIR